MVKQREVLEFIAQRTKEGRPVSFRTLARELDLLPESACTHLKRLWQERLIRSSERPCRYRFHVLPGESIRDLRFRLARRGRERLRWYAEQDEQEAEEDWLW